MNRKLSTAFAFIAGAFVALFFACSEEPTQTSVDAGVDAGTSHKAGASSPYPSGTGLQAVSGGLPLAAAITGDAGFVLTSTGTSTLPTYQAAPSGFTAGGDLSGTSTSQTLVSGLTKSFANVTVTGALHGSVKADGGTDDYGQRGEKLVIPATEVCVGDAGSVVCSGNLRSDVVWTDATTWQTFWSFTPPARTGGPVDFTFFAFDITDAADAGKPDNIVARLSFSYVVSNGGTITLASESGHGIGDPVALTPYGVSGMIDGGATTSPGFVFQVLTSGADVLVQAKGIASRTYNFGGVYQDARAVH